MWSANHTKLITLTAFAFYVGSGNGSAVLITLHPACVSALCHFCNLEIKVDWTSLEFRLVLIFLSPNVSFFLASNTFYISPYPIKINVADAKKDL